MTVLFVDLQGYTRYSERAPPEEVVAMLNRFFRVVVAVGEPRGRLGQQVRGRRRALPVRRAQDQPDHAARALRAAASLPRELAPRPTCCRPASAWRPAR